MRCLDVRRRMKSSCVHHSSVMCRIFRPVIKGEAGSSLTSSDQRWQRWFASELRVYKTDAPRKGANRIYRMLVVFFCQCETEAKLSWASYCGSACISITPSKHQWSINCLSHASAVVWHSVHKPQLLSRMWISNASEAPYGTAGKLMDNTGDREFFRHCQIPLFGKWKLM